MQRIYKDDVAEQGKKIVKNLKLSDYCKKCKNLFDDSDCYL